MIWIGLICHHPPSTTLHHHHLPRSPTHSQLLSFPFLSLHTYSLPYSRQSEYAIRFIVHGPLSTLPSPLSHVHSPFIHSFIHSFNSDYQNPSLQSHSYSTYMHACTPGRRESDQWKHGRGSCVGPGLPCIHVYMFRLC